MNASKNLIACAALLIALFSATSTFMNVRSFQADTEREAGFRQDIWLWMEKSLSQGQ